MTFLNSLVAQINFFGAKKVCVRALQNSLDGLCKSTREINVM